MLLILGFEQPDYASPISRPFPEGACEKSPAAVLELLHCYQVYGR